MNSNLAKLTDLGQSVWFDDINRDVIVKGTLDELVSQYNVTGGTSNPSIFEKAFTSSDAYDEQFRQIAQNTASAESIQDALALTDVQLAADLLRPVYDRTNGADGYVSLEVAPTYATDTEKTLSETRRLFKALDRPNVMIKIPGTPEGLPAIETCLAEGINVNITLLFSVDAYRNVAEAYVRALEKRASEGRQVDNIASVASFFVSRVDTMADDRLTELAESEAPDRKEAILGLRGKLGVANAKMAYQVFLEITASEAWQKLAALGARPQRCLWASTSTKNPAYSDVLYVDELIGADTVNTMPENTLQAFADHGKPASTLTTGVEEARQVISDVAQAGLNITDVTNDLLQEGIEKFADSYENALKAIKERSQGVGVG